MFPSYDRWLIVGKFLYFFLFSYFSGIEWDSSEESIFIHDSVHLLIFCKVSYFFLFTSSAPSLPSSKDTEPMLMGNLFISHDKSFLSETFKNFKISSFLFLFLFWIYNFYSSILSRRSDICIFFINGAGHRNAFDNSDF